MTSPDPVPDLREAFTTGVSFLVSGEVTRLATRVAYQAAKDTGRAAFVPDPENNHLHPIAQWWTMRKIAVYAVAGSRNAVISARSIGMSWEEIGRAMLHDGTQIAAEAAFREAGTGDEIRFDCAGPDGCGQPIVDLGPVSAHPGACETGHADRCGRHTREVTAYWASLDKDGDDQ